jgi:hypothetical protein
MKIKIVKTPPGFAPEQIRQQWVGLEMSAKPEMDVNGSFRIGTENIGGYQVEAPVALQALKDAGKDAALEFWLPYLRGDLVFHAECCEEVVG